MVITTTIAALYVADIIAKKYIGNYFDDNLKAILPKTIYRERLRVVIQKAVDEFDADKLSSSSELLSFTDSEKLFTELLEWQLYKDSKNPLTEESFSGIDNISQPDKEELNKFYTIFIKCIEEDTTLKKIYIEENYKKAVFELKKELLIIKNNIQAVIDNTKVQPQIKNDSIIIDKPNFQFHYTQRITNFLGREEEINSLKEFYNSEKSFYWWLLTGQGGAGKSRLALELCIELRQLNVNCGFISFSQIKDVNWNNWYPEVPTLYIVDYVANEYMIALNWIQYLTNRTDFQLPIRILLVERESDGNWWKAFTNDIVASSSLYKITPLNIEGLPVEKLIKLVKEIAISKNNDLYIEEKDLEKVLINSDALQRPLFAMFVGIALAYGQHVRDWNQHDLLDFYLAQEERNIKNTFSHCDDKTIYHHKNILILATISYGITDSQLNNIFDLNISWLPNRDTFNNALYLSLSGNSKLDTSINSIHIAYHEGEINSVILSPLMPDIVGEYFVLKHLLDDKDYPHRDKERLVEIRKIAYRIGLIGINFFFRRILQDFTNHPTTLRLIKQPYDSFMDTRGITGRYILDLMRSIFNDNKNLMKLLWNYTMELYEESKKFVSEKHMIDTPDHVYSKSTLLMLYMNRGDLEEQIKYSRILKVVTDRYSLSPAMANVSNDDNIFDKIDEARKTLVNMSDPVFAKNWLDNNKGTVAIIPYNEVLGLQEIILQQKSSEKDEVIDICFRRMYELSDLYTDPRIKNIILSTWVSYGKEKIDSLDQKLKDLFEKIIKYSNQIQPINVAEEQFIFLNIAVNQLISDDKVSIRFYYETFLDNLSKRPLNQLTVYTFINVASLASDLCYFYYKKKDLEYGSFYYEKIYQIGELFTKGLPNELLIIGWTASISRLKLM